MKQNVRIYHRFTGYTVQDCACIYCLYYARKRQGCQVSHCCCLEEKRLAAQQELMAVSQKEQ